MPINLTKVKAKVNNIKHKLFYEDSISGKIVAKFYQGNSLELTLEDGFYVSKNPTTNLAIGSEYFEMSVTNPDDRLESTLLYANRVVVGNEEYEIKQFFRPRALTQEWLLRLQPLGGFK